jgi:hypothetical protein
MVGKDEKIVFLGTAIRFHDPIPVLAGDLEPDSGSYPGETIRTSYIPRRAQTSIRT